MDRLELFILCLVLDEFLTSLAKRVGYSTFVRCFSISSSTVKGFLVFCDRCNRPS